jgi:diaminopimelate decarboxylase
VLAARFGTPFYVYDLDAIASRVRELRWALPDRVEIAYAVKANPSLAVVAHLVDQGLGVDVASAGELATALRAGAPPETVVFTGPGKRDEELVAALEHGVRGITVESRSELERLERLAAERGLRARVLLRAAVNGPREGRPIIGGVGALKFGMRPADLDAAASCAAASAHLELVGVHAFGASNVRDADALADHVAWTVALASRVGRRVGVPLQLVDAGGGLGIPYADDEVGLDLIRLGERLGAIHRSMATDPFVAGARLLLEPGRFLVGPGGWYVVRVVDVKRSGRRSVAIADGGIHHLVAPALVGRRHRLSLHAAHPAADPTTVRVLLAGPLCTGLDVLSPSVSLARPAPGDLVTIADVGAYGFTESMPLFLSHATPPEIVLLGGDAHLVRPRIEPAEMLALQRRVGGTAAVG